MTTYVKALAIIKLLKSNSNFHNVFEILPINNFSDDSLICQCILFMALELLKSFSLGLILINLQPSSFLIAFCLSIL